MPTYNLTKSNPTSAPFTLLGRTTVQFSSLGLSNYAGNSSVIIEVQKDNAEWANYNVQVDKGDLFDFPMAPNTYRLSVLNAVDSTNISIQASWAI